MTTCLHPDSAAEGSAAPSATLLPGMAVRHVATGRLGRVHHVHLDNSCSDPECCGGHFPDSAWIDFTCGHSDDFQSTSTHQWDGFETVADDALPPGFCPPAIPSGEADAVSVSAGAGEADVLNLPRPVLAIGATLREIATGQLATITAIEGMSTRPLERLASLHFACGCEGFCSLNAHRQLVADDDFTAVA